MELLCEKIKENFEVGSSACVTMGELAEKINKLVNKIINLEASVSSQAALIQRLRLETNELQAEIQTLEGNDILVNGNNYLREQLRKMEKFYGLQDLNQSEPEKEDRSLIKVESRETALNPDDSPEKHQNVKKKEHHKVSGKFHEDFKGPDGALNPDESLGVQQNLKSQHELKLKGLKENRKRQEHLKNSSQPKKTIDLINYLEELSGHEIEEKVAKKDSPSSMDDLSVEIWEQETMLVDEPDWKRLFKNGMENRVKEVKRQLTEAEKKNGDSLFDATVQVRELKSANEKKDEQIQFLRQKLILLQAGLDRKRSNGRILMDQLETTSEIENRFQMNIDEVLEENLNFWLRFSTSFQQNQKFETEVQDLQAELFKLEEKQKMQDGSSNAKYSLKSDARPLYRHLGEIHTEVTVWLEKSRRLKDEVKRRFASMCCIQDEITAVMKESAEDEEFKFTSCEDPR
uniref:Uncharacterized protein n=1 Tax=Salix viminalis TaxID=40686 RepID=A0A6N2LR28_SALVM